MVVIFFFRREALIVDSPTFCTSAQGEHETYALRQGVMAVVRLERENELEQQRRKTMEAEALADARKPAAGAKPAGAPGRADQLAMVG